MRVWFAFCLVDLLLLGDINSVGHCIYWVFVCVLPVRCGVVFLVCCLRFVFVVVMLIGCGVCWNSCKVVIVLRRLQFGFVGC